MYGSVYAGAEWLKRVIEQFCLRAIGAKIAKLDRRGPDLAALKQFPTLFLEEGILHQDAPARTGWLNRVAIQGRQYHLRYQIYFCDPAISE